jgi:hypothetical protein
VAAACFRLATASRTDVWPIASSDPLQDRRRWILHPGPVAPAFEGQFTDPKSFFRLAWVLLENKRVKPCRESGDMRRDLPSTLMAVIAVALPALPVHATDILYAIQFDNLQYNQSSNSSTTFNQAFYSSGLYESAYGDYSSVGLTCTLGSACGGVALTPPTSPNTEFVYQTPGLASQAAMQAMFGFGTYTLTTNTALTTSYSYAANDYASTPLVTDYSSLQGADAADKITFDLNPYGNTIGASASFIFLTIYDDTTSTQVVDDAFLPATTTSIVVNGGTLSPGNTYTYEVDYSNRVFTPETNSVFDAQLGFDERTDGNFTTAAAAVPEPGSIALLTTGLPLLATGLLGGALKRRRRMSSRA